MTRLYFSAGPLRLKIVGCLAAAAVFFGLAEVAAVHGFLGFPPEEVWRQTLLVTVGTALLFATLGVFSWLALRPTAKLLLELRDLGVTTARKEDPARGSSLRFPMLLATMTLGTGVLIVGAGGFLSVRVFGTSSQIASGMVLASMCVVLLASALLYVMSRHLIRPVTLHFRHEDVPSGLRVSIRSKVLLTLVVISLATSLPVGLICARRIVLVQQEAGRQQLQHLAEVLAYSGTVLKTEQLRDLLASLSLPETRVRLTDQPGPTSSSLPSGHANAYLAPIGHPPPATDDTGIAILVVMSLALATLVGLLHGISLSRDIAGVATRVAAIAGSDAKHAHLAQPSPFLAGVAQFSDVRRLGEMVNALLSRIATINVANFVAIEKTLAANKLKMQFLANVSHDLRSPLNAILGFSELLLRELPSDTDRRRQALASIQRAGSELLRLIDEVLDSAKLEAGRFVLQREDSLPAALVRQAIQELRRQGVPSEVNVEAELQAGLPPIWVDPQRVSQAILYLLRFAVDGTRRGEVVVRVNAQALADEHPGGAHKLLLIRVDAPALQLGEADLGLLFDGFRRLPITRGLGLGLPLARAIFEMHHGTLTVHSAPGVGTTLAAGLPVLQRKMLGRLRPVKV